ncbi:MAG: hypothetical protein ACUVTP_04360 [Candidatus Fervidibacter sp.]|uniref:hypothetical protein n=1 Tax=Candidatus Fervidibacter sp. TaxID=3100871 RepID=UPI00404B408F
MERKEKQEAKTATRKPLEIPSWDLVIRRNSIERMKREKFPLDIVHELPQLIAAGYEAIPGGGYC